MPGIQTVQKKSLSRTVWFISVFLIVSANLLWVEGMASSNNCHIKQYIAHIQKVYPHPKTFFTQGLVFESGILFESIGQYGKSAVLKYGLDTPIKTSVRKMAPHHFGEGLAIVGENLVQLTYRAGTGIVYDKNTLTPVTTFKYRGEGWGLAFNGFELLMSDGTNVIKFLDPNNFEILRRIKVSRCGKALRNINELEYIDKYLYANIWRSNTIVIINPVNGVVEAEIDISQIVGRYKNDRSVDVLNGIAWDSMGRRLFITGKFWPHLYQIELHKKNSEYRSINDNKSS